MQGSPRALLLLGPPCGHIHSPLHFSKYRASMAPAMLAVKQFPGCGDPVVGRDKYKLLVRVYIPDSKI